MHRITSLTAAATLAIVLPQAGCASRNQLTKLMAEKQQLVATIEAEKKENAELVARLQTTSDRAGEAERELALLHNGKPGVSASLVHAPIRSNPPQPSLEQWSRSQPLLRYSAAQRMAVVNVDPTFDSNHQLTLDGRRALDRVADLLASSGAARFGVKVSGIQATAGDAQPAAQQAAAVAQWLEKRGIGKTRIETATRVGSTHVDEEGRRLGGSHSIELEITELPGQAVATEHSKGGDGWTASDRR
jgi:hypothetical protein